MVHTLVMGTNSDEDILKYKGPTILNVNERSEILRAVKWTDEVHAPTPYEPSVEILDQFNCHYYIHGDDPVICDGVNINELLAGMGRFKEIRRTTGVSTTDLTGKLLKLIETEDDEEESKSVENGPSQKKRPPKQTFLQTSTRISNFSNRREPKADDEVVYFALSCDLMHPGVI